MKKLLLTFLLLSKLISCYSMEWEVSCDSIHSFGSPRSIDLNNDNILDIVFGGGLERRTINKVVALDGVTGSTIWQTFVKDEIYTSAKFIDINNDLTPDVIIGGRNANLYALNGKNGSVIWQFYNDTIDPLLNKWYNFYEPQIIKDVNGDGLKDILITNGGNSTFSAGDTIRPTAGYLMILNSLNGTVLYIDSMPDKKETYMTPIVHDFNNDGDDEIIFGTGGESIRGSLWMTHISDLLQNDISNAILLYTDNKKGFIQPPVLADINNDEILDIISPIFNEGIVALNGNDFQVLWERKIPDCEIYSAPAVGFFNPDSIPDFFITASKGIYPNYNFFYEIIVDGKTGNLRIIDSLGFRFQLTSSIVYDKNNDGIDEISLSLNTLDENSNSANYLLEYDVNNDIKTILIDTIQGFNFGCTPLIKDIDNDNFADIVYMYNSLSGSYGVIIKKINSIVPSNNISWSTYLGNNHNGIFKNTRLITGIPNIKNNNNDCFAAYPNPFSSHINIENIKEEISLYNSGMNLISNNLFTKNNSNINLSGLANGTYYLIGNKNNCIQKIVKID